MALRNRSTWPIGFAIALELLPAKSRPTARGFVVTSSTIKEPESPLFRIFAASVCDHDLSRERFCKSCATCAFILISDASRRIEPGNTALRVSPVVRPLFFTGLIERCRNWSNAKSFRFQESRHLEFGPFLRMTCAIEQSTLLPGKELRFSKGCDSLRVAVAAIHIDQAGLNNRIARLSRLYCSRRKRCRLQTRDSCSRCIVCRQFGRANQVSRRSRNRWQDRTSSLQMFPIG